MKPCNEQCPNNVKTSFKAVENNTNYYIETLKYRYGYVHCYVQLYNTCRVSSVLALSLAMRKATSSTPSQGTKRCNLIPINLFHILQTKTVKHRSEYFSKSRHHINWLVDNQTQFLVFIINCVGYL